MAKPLANIRVLDLSIVRAGPVAVRLLADWGADVIRIEQPRSDDSGGVTGSIQSSDAQNLHRNKRGITLDLKHPKGYAVLERLVQTADVLVENFKTDVKHRLKIDYESLSKLNPRLIVGSISGFGQEGPYAESPRVRSDHSRDEWAYEPHRFSRWGSHARGYCGE